jgi:hypothetical protein
MNRLPKECLQIAAFHEPVLEELRQQVLVIRKRLQAVAYVSRRRQAELAAQPPGRTAVVRDGHDGGQIGRVFFQATQERRQAVAAAEGDDLRPSAQPPVLGDCVDHRLARSHVRRQQRVVQAEAAEEQACHAGCAEQDGPRPARQGRQADRRQQVGIGIRPVDVQEDVGQPQANQGGPQDHQQEPAFDSYPGHKPTAPLAPYMVWPPIRSGASRNGLSHAADYIRLK